MLRVLLTAVAAAASFQACPAQSTARESAEEFLEEKVQADPDDFIAWNQLANLRLRKFSESGDFVHLEKAAAAVDRSLKSVPEKLNAEGLALRARLDLAEHRFADARAHAEQLRSLQPGKLAAYPILGDALLELGEVEEAARVLEEYASKGGEGVNLASRLARFALAQGKRDEAREQFDSALQSAKEMTPASPLTVAWCEVQLGELAFRSGDWPGAETHYESALVALPGWWSAREHLAELRGAQGRDAEALEIYTQVIAKTPRPELLQAIGDLHQYFKRGPQALEWHARARDAYLRMAAKGSAQFYHHLAGFYCDAQPNPAEALKWARKDLELRQSAPARAALAWALHKNGDSEAAAVEIGKALKMGAKDSHLLYHAGLIRMSAGDLEGGRAAMREAAAINPHFQAFQVHR